MAAVWADLPADLLDITLSKLIGKDRQSFSLVCHDWKTVAQTSLYRYSPCLMNYSPPDFAWKFYQYNTFLSVPFPDLENAEIRCSKYGWLLMSRYDNTLFFFDPSNNRKLELPKNSLQGYNSVWFFNPPTSPECVVVGIKAFLDKDTDPEIFTLQHGKDKWETKEYTIEDNPDSEFWFNLAAPALHGGLIYFLHIKGDVAVLDINRGRVDVSLDCLTSESDISIVKQYLVEVNGEDGLFAVFVFESSEIEVNVFRLSFPEMRWDSVESIGDKVLYLSHTSSFGCKALSESMENMVCFPLFHGDEAVFYSLRDAKYHSLTGDYSSATTYGLQRWDFATWIMPMPAVDAAMCLSWL